MTPCSGVSMNGFELPQNRNDLLRFTQAIKYDDPDSISLFIGDSLMHRRSGGVFDSENHLRFN